MDTEIFGMIMLTGLVIDTILAIVCGYYAKKLISKLKVNPKLGAITLFNQGKISFKIMGVGSLFLVASMVLTTLSSANYQMYSLISVFSCIPSGILVMYSLRKLNSIVMSAF